MGIINYTISNVALFLDANEHYCQVRVGFLSFLHATAHPNALPNTFSTGGASFKLTWGFFLRHLQIFFWDDDIRQEQRRPELST